MKFKVIEITTPSAVKIKAEGITTVILPTNELLELGEDEVGILEGRFSHHWKGAYFQGGILNPGWKGKITCELLIVGGELQIEAGEQVAHALIFQGENVLGYIFKGTEHWQKEK